VVDGSEVGSAQVPVGRNGWIKRIVVDLTDQGSHDYTSTATKEVTGTDGSTTMDTTYAAAGSPTSVTAALSAGGLTLTETSTPDSWLHIQLDLSTISGWTPSADEEYFVESYQSTVVTAGAWIDAGIRVETDDADTWMRYASSRSGNTLLLQTLDDGASDVDYKVVGFFPDVHALWIAPEDSVARTYYQQTWGSSFVGPPPATGYTEHRLTTLQNILANPATNESYYDITTDTVSIYLHVFATTGSVVFGGFAVWSRVRS